ncbi:carbohydrate kinase family protein [uncultured Paludibaculum sp.]|uniref:carbohydrate kinase family protein n=1 Tax=uncultured Paludibaculum sp. TaxID=1765020 RepID=UPI002AAB5E78|nr:carbohydrate kinase family protein [uncultured Paludibaculum sp.]
MSRIVVLGELNPDLVLSNYSAFPEPGKETVVEDCTLTMGSGAAICAMALAKLGNEVRFVSQVGADFYGDFCLDILRASGIDVTYVERTAATKTGLTVSVSSSRDRALITFMGAIATFDAGLVTPEVFEGFQHLHTSSYFLQPRLRPRVAGVLRLASARGLTTSLDPGFDPAETWEPDLLRTLKEVDVFFPNEVELQRLTREANTEVAVRRICNGRTLTVVKLGANGCLTVAGSGTLRQNPFPIQPVDTTGAGDTFNAGFLEKWLKRAPIEQCLLWGAACGAMSTLKSGGTESQPTGTEVQAFLDQVWRG